MLMKGYGNPEFSRDVMARFPELREALEENAERLHVQMGTLASAVRSAIESGDQQFPVRVCAFLADAVEQPRANPEIENAVAISFVEAYELRESKIGQRVLAWMPERVRRILLEQEARGGAQ